MVLDSVVGAGVELSSAQRGVWFAQRLAPDGSAFTIAQYLDITGAVDAGLLERAIQVVLGEAEATRVRFADESGSPRQYIVPLGQWSLDTIEVADHDEALDWMREQRRAPVDVLGDRLFSVTLIRVGRGRCLLYQRVHHLLLDGYGAALVVSRVAEVYGALVAGQEPGASPFGTLADVLADEADYRASARFTVDRDYWAVAEPVSDSPVGVSDSTNRVGAVLDAETTRGLKETGRSLGTAWSPVVIAAVAACTHRLTGQADVVLGIPVTARRTAVARRTPAMVSNVLPLRVRVTPWTTFGDLVRDCAAATRALLKHQRYRAEDIRRDLALPRDRALYGPTVNILPLDTHMTFGPHQAELHNLSIGPVEDLSIVVQGGDDLRIEVDGNADRYDMPAVKAHLARLLRVLRTDSGATIGSIDLAEPRTWADPVVEAPATTIVDLFANQVDAHPDQPAVSDDTTRLTFRQLDDRVTRLARGLVAAGVGRGGSVAAALPRSTDSIAALLAIARVGACYVPLDVSYPKDRLAYLIEDARPDLVLAHHATRDLLPPGAICLDELPDGPGHSRPPTPHDTAYLIYTSGSTGRPKGVVVGHSSLSNLFHSHRRTIMARARTVTGVRHLRFGHLSGVAFDAAWDPVLWLLDGHEVRVVPDEVRRDPERCVALLEAERVDVVETTPSYARQLVASGAEDHPAVWALGGEPIDADLWRELPGSLGINLYGPTESTVDATYAFLADHDQPTIGGPVDNARAYVLDVALRPAPSGVPGELYIAGAGVARGYHDRPARTAERFVPDPFGVSGERMYRTGDIVVRSEDGALRYLRRSDDQVKIRGVRVEPGEVREALAALDGVVQAAVVVQGEGPEARLLAYAVGTADPDHLRGELAATLPAHLVPQSVTRLDALPLTPNGKLDKARLPRPGVADRREPADDTERALCRVFADVLDLPSVGPDDDFFALGGHSLLAARVTARVRTDLGAEASIRTLFDASTPAALARALGSGGDRPRLVRRPRPDRAPLSAGQRRLWFLDRLNPGSAEYLMPVLLRLDGDVDVAALRAAVSDLVERHESLRTVVAESDGAPFQIVLPCASTELAVARVDDVDAAIGVEIRRGFDLTAETPLRATLFSTSATNHALLLLIHHIAADGWSFGPLARDLAVSYDARRKGNPAPLPPLPVTYTDYALWQQDLLGDEHQPTAYARQRLDHWTTTLAGLPDEIPLPTDRPRPAAASGAGGAVSVTIPAEAHRKLAHIAAEHGVSVFMALHAGLAALLSAYGAGSDIPIGTPVAARAETGLEDVIGFFATTAVLRADVSGDPTFTELLARVRDDDLAALENADLPFEWLVNALAPPRLPGRNPLFQVMLALRNTEEPVLDLDGLRVTPDRTPRAEAAKFDLLVDVAERHTSRGEPAGIAGSVEYNADLFDESTARRLADAFTDMLDRLATEPDRPLHTIHAQGRTWSGPSRPIPDGTVVDHLMEITRAHPGRTAVVCGDEELTFAELTDRADGLARALVDAGVRPEQPVAVALPRSVDTIVALVAVLRAGGAYLPIDLDYPEDRIAYLLAQAEPAAVITAGAIAPDVPVLSPDQRGTGPLPRVAADSLAYLLYTSGSTGHPKGVAVAHRSLVNLLLSHRERVFPAAGREVARVAHTAGVSFDASWDPVLWMIDGHELHVLTDAVRRDPEALLDYVRTHRVDAMETTPSYLRHLIGMGLLDPARPRPVVLALGGEAVDRALWGEVGVPGVTAFNFYGPTESTVDALVADVSDSTRPLIGSPIANTGAVVLDALLRPVPLGVTGELYLSGAGLARGYLGRAALTAERFVADPFGAPGERLYRTGDLVRPLPAGGLEFVGRADHQVKLRGFRVELGEIEAVLSRVDAVSASAVVVREDRLLGYVVAPDGTDPKRVRELAARELPDYMVPRSITVLAELPLTPNGKLDRDRLPEPQHDAEAAGATSPTEEALCELFATTLDLPSVGPDDDFFALGGHSLLVTRLVSRVRGRLGVDLPIRAVFEAPTPAALAARCVDAGTRRPALAARPRPGRVPLSPGQARMWFLNAFEGSGYHIPMSLRLRGDLDVPALRGALADLLRRHESLRTVFPTHDGVPHQVVLPDALIDLPEVDPVAAADTVSRPFDLERDIPLRACLIRQAPDDHVLLLVAHHIAADGWSTAPLARDVATAYAARTGLDVPAQAPLPVQYADYALWQRDVLGSDDDPESPLNAQLAYWRQALAGVPEELALPYDRPRRAGSGAGGAVRVDLPANLRDQLSAYAAEHGASLFMVLHAGLAALLSRIGGGTDIPIGTPVAGRTDEALDDLVGFFVNTLVLRADVSGDPSMTTLLDRVRSADLAAFDRQDVPFDRVVEAIAPTRVAGRHPLFQVLLTLQNTERPTIGLPGLDVEVVDQDRVTGAKFDLSLTFAETGSGLAGTLEYSADVFDRTTVERVSEWYTRLLTFVVSHPDHPIGDVPLLSREEWEIVLREWNGIEGDARPLTVVDVFERRAHDGHTAVVASGESLTAAELDADANRLARHLRSKGIGAGHTVAVALPRSVRTAGALLAVLKSGAAYLPVDLSYPRDRVEYILDDAAPTLVITDGSAGDVLPEWAERIDLDDIDLTDQPTAPLTDAERLVPLSPTHPAYVIYTSGSTGRPKGVVVEHRSLTNLLDHHIEHVFRPAAGTRRMRVALTAAVSFDASWDPVLWMIAGHELHVVDDDTRRDASALVDHLRDNAIDVIETTPSYLRELMACGLFDGPAPSVVAIGGERVDEGMWRRLRAVDGLTAYNFYGPTESTVDSVVAGLRDAESPVIGSPVRNTRAYVLDARLRPVPAGVPGELYLAGAGVARGYLNRTPLTAERFVADPFGGAGQRMYRTGDLARWRTDAGLEFFGRADTQVKVRGFRVEPGEVETLLRAHPEVTAAAVVARDDRLVAYVVPAAGPVDTEDLRGLLASSLPGYMVPSVFMTVDGLPLTPNGKLDERALPAPETTGDRAYRGPRSPREDLLCKLFAEALGVARVGIDDGFFDLGGHSLLAGGLIGRIRTAFGVTVPMSRLFEHPTVAGLAGALDRSGGGSDLDVLLPLRTGGTKPPLFCVHPASGLAWTYSGLLRHLAPDQPLYGLQSRKLTDPAFDPADIGEIAAEYVTRIREVQPHGPYRVLGWSFGGNLAHEVAVRLEAAGERLETLILLDAYPGAPEDGLDVADESVMFAALLHNQGVDAPEGPLDRARVLEVYREVGNPMGALTEDALGAMVGAFTTQARLMRDHVPGRFGGDVLFFTAVPDRSDDGPDLTDWLPYLAGRIDNHDVDVRHAQLTQPHSLAVIGPVIAAHLDAPHQETTP